MLSYLLSQPGIDPNTTNNHGTPLQLAAESGQADLITVLCGHPQTDPNRHVVPSPPPLHLATDRNHVTAVQALLASPRLLPNLLHKNLTSLALAASKGHVDIFRTLLADPRVDVNARSRNGLTPLMLAAQNGHVAIVRMLMAHPSTELNAQSRNGTSALFLACSYSRAHVVRELLSCPALDPTLVNYANVSPFTVACYKASPLVVKILLASPRNPFPSFVVDGGPQLEAFLEDLKRRVARKALDVIKGFHEDRHKQKEEFEKEINQFFSGFFSLPFPFLHPCTKKKNK